LDLESVLVMTPTHLSAPNLCVDESFYSDSHGARVSMEHKTAQTLRQPEPSRTRPV